MHAHIKADPNSLFAVILFAFPKTHSKGKRVKSDTIEAGDDQLLDIQKRINTDNK